MEDYVINILKFITSVFKAKHKTYKYGKLQRELAEALLWRDDEVSIGAIPAPIEKQPDYQRYMDDAEYLLNWIVRKFELQSVVLPRDELQMALSALRLNEKYVLCRPELDKKIEGNGKVDKARRATKRAISLIEMIGIKEDDNVFKLPKS